ncbi:DUF91 domain-containing protein [Candidatus Woesearchaeota archaeon]|nr:MAG: DUF91 domain-containing protein [Candidatus Woesearchaeota archaeon]
MLGLDDFRERFEQAISRNECAACFLSCEISYSGRAEAFLARGDRLIVLKADNTLQVHQPEGSAPVNYMKAGSSFSFSKLKSGALLLRCAHAREKEFLDVVVFAVHGFFSARLEDGQKLVLVGNEADMSDMIKQNPALIEDGFKPLSREEHTKVGFIDVFGYDERGNLVVVECKRYRASLAAVTQLRRYVEKIKKLRGVSKVRGVLAAPAVTKNALAHLHELGFEFVSVSPPKRLERYWKDQKSLGDF